VELPSIRLFTYNIGSTLKFLNSNISGTRNNGVFHRLERKARREALLYI
jgi:hypothetical protein